MASAYPSAVADVGPGGAQRVVGADHVDVEGPLEDGRIAADEGQLRRDAGVGDHDVEASEHVDRSLDGAFDLVAVGDVARPPRPVDRVGDLGQQVVLDPGHGHPGSAAVEAASECGPDASGGTGDEHPPTGDRRCGEQRHARTYLLRTTLSIDR